jgi:hypothetical protein
VQIDLSRWDYKHQVLESAYVPNWRVLLWVKMIEMICQLRPKSLLRLMTHPDRRFRAGMRWYSNIGRRVWPHEIWQWLFFDRRTLQGPTLAAFLKGGWKSGLTSRTDHLPAGSLERLTPTLRPARSEISPLSRITPDSLPLPRVVDSGELATSSSRAEVSQR